MKTYLKLASLQLIIIWLFSSCGQQNKNPQQNPSKVEIKSVDGDYNFFVNGELFELKGAGYGALNMVK